MRNGDLVVRTGYEVVYDDARGMNVCHTKNLRADEVDIAAFTSLHRMKKWEEDARSAYGLERMAAEGLMTISDLFGEGWYARWQAKRKLLWSIDALEHAFKGVERETENVRNAVKHFEEVSCREI